MQTKDTLANTPLKELPDLSEVQKVRVFIREHWAKTVRTSSKDHPREIVLPCSFVVPTVDPLFNRFFYWDTFFACEGLLRDGLVNIARNSAENMMYLVENIGFIPNLAATDCHRTQLPVSSLLYRAVYEKTGDKVWLSRALAAIMQEHAFWTAFRSGPDQLNRPGHHDSPKEISNFYWCVRDRLKDIPADLDRRFEFLAHAVAECEVWDFTPRFSMRAMDYYPVDTNALLFAMEENAAWFAQELADPRGAAWRKRAETRQQLMNDLLWNEEIGFYFDYDYVNRRPSTVVAASGFFPLMCGAASPEQASRIRSNLGFLERKGGILTCAPGAGESRQTYQWDYPNAWPPCQYAAVSGLLRYGFRADAERIAAAYVRTATHVFRETGLLWEKYNAETGSIDVKDEYQMPPMLGWTAGVYVYCCDVLGI